MLTAILYKNLATWQLGNCLATQKLPSVEPLSIGFYLTWQLGNSKFQLAKLKAFIHALGNLATTLYIYNKALPRRFYLYLIIQILGAR